MKTTIRVVGCVVLGIAYMMFGSPVPAQMIMFIVVEAVWVILSDLIK